MKKLTFSLLFATLCQYAMAQSIQFGALMGGNLSWIAAKENTVKSTSDSKFGMMLGCYIRKVVSDKFALQPELMFAGYGGKFSTEKEKVNYIALPVLAKMNFTDEIFGLTGPQVGVMVRAKNEAGDNLSSKYKTLYASWLFGLGYSFNEIGLDAAIRYNLGLSNIAEASDITMNMNAFQFVLAYRLVGGDD